MFLHTLLVVAVLVVYVSAEPASSFSFAEEFRKRTIPFIRNMFANTVAPASYEHFEKLFHSYYVKSLPASNELTACQSAGAYYAFLDYTAAQIELAEERDPNTNAAQLLDEGNREAIRHYLRKYISCDNTNQDLLDAVERMLDDTNFDVIGNNPTPLKILANDAPDHLRKYMDSNKCDCVFKVHRLECFLLTNTPALVPGAVNTDAQPSNGQGAAPSTAGSDATNPRSGQEGQGGAGSGAGTPENGATYGNPGNADVNAKVGGMDGTGSLTNDPANENNNGAGAAGPSDANNGATYNAGGENLTITSLDSEASESSSGATLIHASSQIAFFLICLHFSFLI